MAPTIVGVPPQVERILHDWFLDDLAKGIFVYQEGNFAVERILYPHRFYWASDALYKDRERGLRATTAGLRKLNNLLKPFGVYVTRHFGARNEGRVIVSYHLKFYCRSGVVK